MADLADKSLEELEAMLSDPENIQRVEPEPEPPPQEPAAEEPPPVEAPPEPAPPPAEEPPPAEAEPKAEAPAETATPDPVFDLSRLEDERREVVLQKLMAHNSRLAARLGNLEKNRASRTEPASYEPEVADEGVVSQLQRRIDQMEDAQRSEARERALQDEVKALRDGPYLKGVDPSLLATAAQKYEASWNEAAAETDPELARLGARSVLLTVAAEARRIQLDKANSDAAERKASQVRNLTEAKRKASVSASGAPPAPKAPEKPLAERSVKELEALLDQMTG